ncbi:MAG: 50S ribosomal protein L3 N(5)-glutamine methyltransferase [Limnohabitans sp.]|nr:50S ribosomal protein L3 N(5)-glutamine methyltransferase [Limnohabitans sp.]
MTPVELIDHCATDLIHARVAFGQGTLNAQDEAAWLVLWALNLPLDTDTGTFISPLADEDIQHVLALLRKRIETRQPMAYLTGESWLLGVSFHVDQRCLIPRSLIAEVIAHGSMDPWLHPDSVRALDLCTGGGSLAVLLALVYPQLQIDGLDISADALAVALINIERHGLHERIETRLSDGLTHASGVYDLIVCNPPYVNAHSMSTLPAEFRLEPEIALAGGEDGMDFIRNLIQQASSFLSEDGVLVLEIGHEIEHFNRAFPALDVMYLSTSAGDEQVMLITRQALLS